MKQLTALTFFCLWIFFARASTFIVTSNADSGPGTLRQALLLVAANGTSVADTIVFNMPGLTEADRTITLQTELPAVSANITIDGSTQPGSMLGISNAKVVLYLDHYTSSPFVFLFVNNASNVKIYGLCFNFFENPDAAGGGNYAIYLRNSSQITVGAPGKGNLFSAVRAAITNNFWNYYTDSIRGVTVQSNVFGLNSINWPVRRGSIELIRAAEITVGGPLPAEGNIFVGASINLRQTDAFSAFFAKVQNNKFNLDWTGSRYFQEGGNLILSGSTTDDTLPVKTFVFDNIFSGGWPGGIGLDQLYHKVLIKGNKLGTDITGTVCKGGYNDLSAYQCKNVTVGGYTAAEENIFVSLVLSQRHGMHLIKNQFGGIMLSGPLQNGDPFVKIIGYDNGLITGKANPNSKIQLYTNNCNIACIDRKYLTTTYANSVGDWNFNYTAAMPNIIATATTADSSTSEFSAPNVNNLNVVVKHATCGKSNGSVTGIVVTEGTHIRWLDSYTLQVVSTDTNLVNVPAGSYVLAVSNGINGCIAGANYTINNLSPPAAISTSITNAYCGGSNGSIYSNVPQSLSLKWLNASGDSIGNYTSCYNLLPGTYYLKAWVPGDTTCNKTYGPYAVQNQSGPTLNINGIQITAAVCNANNGSITGVTATNTSGTPQLRWVDSLNNIVGSTYDLLNISPGKYRLKFKDAGGCDTIFTPYYIVGNTGEITIDATAKLVQPAKCTGNTGSIRNITITGGSTYLWKNVATGTIAGATSDVFNLPAGSYQLTVTNNFGCSKISPVIVVPQTTFLPISVLAWGSKAANCGQPNGNISAQTFTRDTSLYFFRWVDSSTNQTVGGYTRLLNIYSGTYALFAKDSNGCEKQIFKAAIAALPMPYFDYSTMQVVPDKCLSGEGIISGLVVKDMRGGTGTYAWLNTVGDSIGNTLNIQHLSQGSYRLKATDLIGCTVISTPVKVDNINAALSNPQYDEQTVLKNTAALLKIKNAGPGTYQLFDDPLAATPLQQNTTGIFTTPVLTADKLFYVRYVNGVCSSNLVTLKITVVDKTAIYVPTAFTPNNDGKNETLKAVAYGKIKLHYFTVYNRWGQVVFSTTNFNKGWDGLINGQQAAAGTYVWIIKALDELTGKTIEQKGTVTIIR